ncbi:DUF3149 domain-containing protein [Oceanisphaera avium]|uniref:DUF3149 domain-containing protein n=1 Tax=Oceanisphaera avium TaxID=1903694 RepID=A0A1Y0CU95_9GAMM|nr:DUF3149 domain-containing protein [Oceanisphaera avium]ART78862.1 DUF3149 domain-containing protein [Oceanisphaera avium]
MAFWLDLMFGSDIGFMSMMTIIVTTVIVSSICCYFVYKVRTSVQPEEEM